MEVNEHSVVLEIDTGASATINNKETWTPLKNSGSCVFDTTKTKLKTYFGKCLNILKKTTVNVKHKDMIFVLSAVIVDCKVPNLLGRDWLPHTK